MRERNLAISFFVMTILIYRMRKKGGWVRRECNVKYRREYEVLRVIYALKHRGDLFDAAEYLTTPTLQLVVEKRRYLKNVPFSKTFIILY